MKIVIDIPDEEYENVKKAGGCYYDFGKAIYYGTPLPKGHGRLIDADKLKEVYENTEDAEYCQWTLYGVTSEIDDAPTIIEADTESEDNYAE